MRIRQTRPPVSADRDPMTSHGPLRIHCPTDTTRAIIEMMRAARLIDAYEPSSCPKPPFDVGPLCSSRTRRSTLAASPSNLRGVEALRLNRHESDEGPLCQSLF